MQFRSYNLIFHDIKYSNEKGLFFEADDSWANNPCMHVVLLACKLKH